MVDPFLDPLDAAPVNQASPIIRQRYDALSKQPTKTFQNVLSNQIQQEPTPVMTSDALRVPALSPHQQSTLSPVHEPTASNPRQNPPISYEPSSEKPVETPIENDNLKSVEKAVESLADLTAQPPVKNLAEVINHRVPETESVIETKPELKLESKPESEIQSATSAISDDSNRPTPISSPTPSQQTPVQEPLVNDTISSEITDTQYSIRRGDTLSGIVLKAMRNTGQSFGTADVYRMVQVVADYNHMSNPHRIYPGGKIDLAPIYSGEMIAESLSAPSASVGDLDSALMALAYQAPVTGTITSEFGHRTHPIFQDEQFHNGVDIAVAIGTPVHPMNAGLVTFSGEKSGYGQIVEIAHDDGTQSLYGHLSKRNVEKGDYISERSLVGLSGETGLATGPHLHFEIHREGTPIDPLTVFSREQIQNAPQFARGERP